MTRPQNLGAGTRRNSASCEQQFRDFDRKLTESLQCLVARSARVIYDSGLVFRGDLMRIHNGSDSTLSLSLKFALCLSLLTLAVPARSQTQAEAPAATSSTRASEFVGQKKFEETQTISDAKLKADGGSLSRFSMKGSLSYFGPTFGDLSAADQPNPDGGVGVYAQAVRGSVSGRYRFSSDSAMSAGTGVAFLKPFHGWERTDVNNPFVSYDFNSRWAGIQARNSLGASVTTVPNYRNTGQVGGLNAGQSFVYRLMGSGWALSFDYDLSYWIFERSYRPGSTRRGGDGLVSQWTMSWIPGVKYNFSDKLNVNATVGFLAYNPRSTTDLGVIWSRTPTLRLGAGYALTRDVYLNPYIQGFATNMRAEMVTMNVSGVFSVL